MTANTYLQFSACFFSNPRGEMTTNAERFPGGGAATERVHYETFVPEGIVLNALGASLVGLAILMPVIVLLRCRVRCGDSLSTQSSGDDESERL